jgi:glycerophosphoryl diester phosphodiesterase
MSMSRPGLHIPKVIGHRGAALRAPENTIAGFRKAAELGCRWVEFDVRLSLEDRPVVFHDDTLERTTDGTGRVGATPLGDLLSRDAGGYFDFACRGERIPTLDETLMLLPSLGLGCDLEMKPDLGREQALAETVASTIERCWPKTFPFPLVTSFSALAIEAFADLAPHIPRGYLTTKLPSDWQVQAGRFGAAAVICDHKSLTLEDVRAVSGAGFPLLVYTVNQESRAEQLFACGIDSVISDAPDTILAGHTDQKFEPWPD